MCTRRLLDIREREHLTIRPDLINSDIKAQNRESHSVWSKRVTAAPILHIAWSAARSSSLRCRENPRDFTDVYISASRQQPSSLDRLYRNAEILVSQTQRGFRRVNYLPRFQKNTKPDVILDILFYPTLLYIIQFYFSSINGFLEIHSTEQIFYT